MAGPVHSEISTVQDPLPSDAARGLQGVLDRARPHRAIERPAGANTHNRRDHT
jgi:hypothetical protein